MEYPIKYPAKLCVCKLSDGTRLYETVNSNEEYDQLVANIEAEKQRVRDYFSQYGV